MPRSESSSSALPLLPALLLSPWPRWAPRAAPRALQGTAKTDNAMEISNARTALLSREEKRSLSENLLFTSNKDSENVAWHLYTLILVK